MDVTLRRLPRARWLNGQTVAGVVLFALALAGGTRVLAQAAATHPVLVATRPIPAGATLSASDLRLDHLKIDRAVLANYLTSTAEVEGTVAVHAFAAGELVARSGVTTTVDDRDMRSLTLPVTPDHAVGGDLRAGDRVDVYATFGGAGRRARTALVASGLEVLDVLDGAGGMLETGLALGVTVAVPSEGVADLAAAIRTAELDLARNDSIRPETP